MWLTISMETPWACSVGALTDGPLHGEPQAAQISAWTRDGLENEENTEQTGGSVGPDPILPLHRILAFT